MVDIVSVLKRLVDSPMIVAKGGIGSTSVSADTYIDVAVTFDESLAAAPMVIPSLVSTSTSSDIGKMGVSVINATATGFTLRIFNGSANTRAPGVNWIAVI